MFSFWLENERGTTIMPSTNIKQLSESTRDKLKSAIEVLEPFLNNYSLVQLVSEEKKEDEEQFYKGFLADLRHLLVYTEVSYEKLGVILRRPNFDEDFAERALYEVYHNCVNAFFYPKNECYSEDGRYAYTGQDAIRFRFKPKREARNAVMNITTFYEELRDELSYYESDYMTKKRMLSRK